MHAGFDMEFQEVALAKPQAGVFPQSRTVFTFSMIRIRIITS